MASRTRGCSLLPLPVMGEAVFLLVDLAGHKFRGWPKLWLDVTHHSQALSPSLAQAAAGHYSQALSSPLAQAAAGHHSQALFRRLACTC